MRRHIQIDGTPTVESRIDEGQELRKEIRKVPVRASVVGWEKLSDGLAREREPRLKPGVLWLESHKARPSCLIYWIWLPGAQRPVEHWRRHDLERGRRLI